MIDNTAMNLYDIRPVYLSTLDRKKNVLSASVMTLAGLHVNYILYLASSSYVHQ